jgi:glycerol kinase
MAKNTYGTGCFMLHEHRPRGARFEEPAADHRGLADRRRTQYALEGSVFIGGAVVQWLRDGLGLIRSVGRCRSAGRQRARCRRRVSWCRPSPGSARRTGTPTRAARWWA